MSGVSPIVPQVRVPLSDLEIQVGIAKVSRYAERESGDTVELTERPTGGVSVVLADGQGHGRPAKTLANLVARKAVGLIAEGARDGATARAVSDFLLAYRHGQVSTELSIISVDLSSGTLVVSRNSHCPAVIAMGDHVVRWDAPSVPVGLYPDTKPTITEIPLKVGVMVVAMSDGIADAGRRSGQSFDILATVDRLYRVDADAQTVASTLLDEARELDSGRPADDMSVVCVAMRQLQSGNEPRRLTLLWPVP